MVPTNLYAEAENQGKRKDDGCNIIETCKALWCHHCSEKSKLLHQIIPLEFQTILERLIAQELRSQNEDEERCRSLDFAIRRQQMARREAAAASEKKGKSKHWDGVGRK